ncbi:hypothetical protein BYT27DRAFT_7093215 [Phlegmacium glaucopus]|nr:hypothetical protein BYT27DRAFT_7093215 [Phlegmacium glaucopus]
MHHPSSGVGTQAEPSNSRTARYAVKSSDVLQDMRVNVSEEGSEKERFLGEDEIIENLVHNPTNTICWTIHRPKRGWYIRIRSPGFPPGVFIPLVPVPQTAQYHTEASMSFSSRTNIPGAAAQLGEEEPTPFTIHDDDEVEADISSPASIHSYPPTPTIGERSSSSSFASTSLRSSLKPIPTQITQFVLAPSSIQPTHQPANASFFTRALSILKSHQPSHSNSFTLSRLLTPSPLSSPPPYVSTVALGPDATSTDNVPLPLHPPLLVFHDRTPLLTVRSLTGLIEVDRAEERLLGVDTSFWIAMVLTYLEFLEERESYLAALSD